jgi:hypothetical protein
MVPPFFVYSKEEKMSKGRISTGNGLYLPPSIHDSTLQGTVYSMAFFSGPAWIGVSLFSDPIWTA